MFTVKEIENYVEKNFPPFGVNKKREIVRLIFEIVKRENIPFDKLISEIENNGYKKVKKFLVNRRYPNFNNDHNLRLYLPEIKIDRDLEFLPQGSFKFNPKTIYVEQEAEGSYLVKRFKEFFPEAKIVKFYSLRNYVREKEFGIADYNRRRGNIFLVKEKKDFYKKCPCTKKAVYCGYYIFNLGLGCIYECVYCYLQHYLNNSPGIIIPTNISDFFEKFPQEFSHSSVFKNVRLGSGEFGDSLALDEITEWSLELIDFFRKRKEFFFEFKTKSKNINNLLKIKPEKNIIVSWSLNPQNIVDSLEFYTASLKERLSSARACTEHGFRVGIHLDPVIYYKKWEDDYSDLVNLIFETIPKEKIAWMSIGTLRLIPELKKIIENRFPENKILDEELFLDFDNKLRYHPNLRIMIYKKIYSWIRKRTKTVPLYLCMENKEVWREVYGFK